MHGAALSIFAFVCPFFAHFAFCHPSDELGHNLGFAHSGEGPEGEYGDHSSLMGNSYREDDGPAMCFNGAKSYQSGWYADATKTITPTDNGNTCFFGPLYGVADYEAGNSAKTVVVKINDDRGYKEHDYFVAFNRKTGINAGTKEGGNKVLITKAAREGLAHSQSWLVAQLASRQSYTIKNFGGTAEDLKIKVEQRDLDARGRAFAQVRIEYTGEKCEGTFPPTLTPTLSPTQTCNGKILDVNLITDEYPLETSWTLTNLCTGKIAARVDRNTVYTTERTSYYNDFCVDKARYEFKINDSYKDGICCNNGPGSYKVRYGRTVVASGREFKAFETATFGTCVVVSFNVTLDSILMPTHASFANQLMSFSLHFHLM